MQYLNRLSGGNYKILTNSYFIIAFYESNTVIVYYFLLFVEKQPNFLYVCHQLRRGGRKMLAASSSEAYSVWCSHLEICYYHFWTPTVLLLFASPCWLGCYCCLVWHFGKCLR